MSWLREFCGRGFKPFVFAPAERFVLRLLTAFTIFLLPTRGDLDRTSLPFPGNFDHTTQPHPNGIAQFFDISWAGDPAIYPVIYWGLVALCVPYVIGIALPVVLPLIAGLHILVFTLNNSQGAIGHDNQILSLILLGQAVAVVLPLLWTRRGRVFPPAPDAAQLRDYLFNVSLQVIAAAYVLAGLAKLIRSKGLWIWQTPDLVVEMVKTNDQRLYSRADDPRGVELADTIAFMSENPGLARIILGGGFLIELFAFLLLYNRRWALAFGIGLFALHRSILWLMKLGFPENEQLVLIYLVNPAFWLLAGWAWLRRDRERTTLA